MDLYFSTSLRNSRLCTEQLVAFLTDLPEETLTTGAASPTVVTIKVSGSERNGRSSDRALPSAAATYVSARYEKQQDTRHRSV